MDMNHLPLGAESCPRQTEIEAEARSSVPGSSIDRALAFTSSYVPAFDFVPSYPVGLVACSDGQRVGERKTNVRQQTCRK